MEIPDYDERVALCGFLHDSARNLVKTVVHREQADATGLDPEQFTLKNTSGQTILWLSNIGEITLTFYRDLPDDAEIKTVTTKQEPTGKWYAILGVETPNDPPAKPENPNQCVGIDVGILNYAHDTDGTAVKFPDFSDERERLERAQRALSSKEHGSANWEKQRRVRGPTPR